MTNFILLIVSTVLLQIGECDLIGFNRLGNNVHSHRQFRNDISMDNYDQKVYRWVLEHNGKVSMPHSLPKIQRTTGRKNLRNNIRFNLYKQRMLKL